MRFVTKFVAAAAVLGTLAFASTASAGFTPPSSLVPYLPAANQATVTQTGAFGNVVIYTCSMGGTISVVKGTPLAQVVVRAESNCSWQKFLTSTVAPGDLTNGSVVQASQIYWTQNVYIPYYLPLLQAASGPSAKAAAVRRR
jgi:hypothetical protein